MDIEAGEGQRPVTANENRPPAVQKIYSAELITHFGAGYITLSPDYKEVLSFIFGQNSLPIPACPGAGAIAEALWAFKIDIINPGTYEAFQKKIKDMTVALEKGGFIIKAGHNKVYKINGSYAAAGNLFT